MSNITYEIRHFHSLLGQLKIRHQKSAILEGCGVKSTKDLTLQQLKDINENLRNQSKDQKADAPKKIRTLRSQVLTLINNYGIYQNQKDWSRVNKFLMQKQIAGKLLYQMNEDELNALKRKMHVLVKKRNEKIQELKNIATQN